MFVSYNFLLLNLYVVIDCVALLLLKKKSSVCKTLSNYENFRLLIFGFHLSFKCLYFSHNRYNYSTVIL